MDMGTLPDTKILFAHPLGEHDDNTGVSLLSA